MNATVLRRRQVDRSAAMRGLLIRAAIECLCDAGFSGSGTASIAQRAGVTTGALHHHFSTKADLMIGVFDHCNAQLGERLLRAKPNRGGTVDVAKLVSHLWEVYGDPEYWAIWEIIIGTRGDVQFHSRAVAHRLATMRTLIHPWVEGLGVPEAKLRAVADLMEFMLISIRGLRLERFVHQDPVYFRRNLKILVDLVGARLRQLAANA
ncbi:MAG: TetR/AcrR family transcriptional regulator [Proteobacteria bacterium]|nr:TetR/AcrR family transcriptional regulator [Pseudomonadota bacterium]